MFDSLVDLYSHMFNTYQYHILIEDFPSPSGVPPHIHAARCYISMWFLDLYASNRKAIRDASPFAFAFHDHYSVDFSQVVQKYDHYLALLNASIRPTFLKNSLDNALYIPVIADLFSVNKHDNPFGISNFTCQVGLFNGLICTMKESNLWHFTKLSGDIFGRPCWLFDRHTENRVYSWFSQEGNYNLEDVTLAYILGTACTPNLGPRDDDDWQYFPEGVVPQNPNPLDYDRIVERGFYGSCEVRTMEIDTGFSSSTAFTLGNSEVSTAAKRSKGLTQPAIAITGGETSNEPAQEDDPLMPRFKLTDWVCHHQVVLNMGTSTRFIAHSSICNPSELSL